MRLNFACLIFVARDDYENILTAKISRFTVYVSHRPAINIIAMFFRYELQLEEENLAALRLEEEERRHTKM